MEKFLKKSSINILLLSCGLNAGYHFSKTLKERFNNKFKIIGADINKPYLVSNYHYIDTFYQVPFSNEANYYETIIEICRKEKIDYIIPTFDNDQMLFYPENEDLKSLGIISLSTPKNTLEFYKNKALMFEKLKTLKLPVPEIYSIKDLKEQVDYFIKPVNGVGSKGAQKTKKHEIEIIENINSYLVQEVCSEPEITLECFHYNGRLSCAARQRIETKAGVCTKAKVFYSAELEGIAKQLVQKIECPHFFNLQFMKNDKNEFVITDINLRFAAGMSLTYAAGWDEVSSIGNLMLGNGEEKIFEPLNLNCPVQYVTRAYTDIVTKKVKKIIGFDLDGTILNSFDRHTAVLSDALKIYNITLNLSDFIDSKRNGSSTYEYLISKNIPSKTANEINKYWCNHIEDEKYLVSDFLYANVEKKLKDLSKDNELILITARNNRKNCLNQLKKLGITKYFSEIHIVKSDANTYKQKARILKESKVSVYIGDTESDKEACDISGIKFEPVFYGFRTEKYLTKN